MTSDDRFEEFLADLLAQAAPASEPERLVPEILRAARRARRRPRWLALIKEQPMRHSSRVAVGSPTLRLASVLAIALVTLLTTSAVMVGASALLSSPTPERPAVQQGGPGAFSPAPSMALARASHTATLLRDGRLLMVGGEDGSSQLRDEAELRDPVTGSFAATASMSHPRRYHTATLLEDGRVLIVGGRGEEAPDPAEVWVSITGTFGSVAATVTFHDLHTATLLQDGRVLIVGGGDTGVICELWDPVSEAFTQTGSLAHGRAWHSATLLDDGRVLVTGGNPLAELWDPETGSFEPAGTLADPRVEHTATLLEDDSVLVVGGMAGTTFGGSPITSVERWDPATRTFATLDPLAEPRAGHTATLLPDGRVLVAGGYFIPSVEIWDDESASFGPAGSMADARGGHTATLLDDGRVLVAGGYQEGEEQGVIASTETWASAVWTASSPERDWPGPLRSEPFEGAPVIVPPAWTADDGSEDPDYHYTDPLAEEGVGSFPLVDIIEMNLRNDGMTTGFWLAGRPDPTHPSDRWLAYGLVLDRDLDGRPDVRIGIDNAPGGEHRFWRTDLVTGETIAQTGAPYDRINDLPSTYFPGEGDVEGSRAGFRYAFRYDNRATPDDPMRYYFWASQIEDGRIVATDYAPDTGWLETP